MIDTIKILTGDCRECLTSLPPESVQCCVTSPPYWGLRDYGHADQIGLEPTPQAYVETMREVFAEVWRVLKDDGTLWLNLGDSYARAGGWSDNSGLNGVKRGMSGRAVSNVQKNVNGQKLPPGLKSKDLIGIPWRVALALQADGWYLRSDIIWHKPNPMPESVTDRPTRSHEYIFLLTKSERYYYDHEAIREKAVTMEDDKSHHSFGTPGGKTELTPGKTRKESGKKWNPKMGGGGTSFNGHSGNYKANGEPIGGLLRSKRSVWTVPTSPYPDSHFATFPPDLIKPCILAGTKPGDAVLDPFGGSGTTGMVAVELGRNAILIELNENYCQLAKQRCNVTPGLKLL